MIGLGQRACPAGGINPLAKSSVDTGIKVGAAGKACHAGMSSSSTMATTGRAILLTFSSM